MTDTPDRGGAQEPFRLIRPYGNPSPLSRRARFFLIAGLLFFCLIYGAAWAFAAPYLIIPLLVPLVVLLAIYIWALPDTNLAPVPSVEYLFFALLVSLVLWPNYLAIDLPGMPWITVNRLTSTPLVVVMLLCVSSSQQFRADCAAALRSAPWVWKLVVAFAVIQTVSVVFSHNKGGSFSALLNDQSLWTASFFAGAYVFSKPGRVKIFAFLLVGMALCLGLLGLWEYRLNRLPWAGHIPSFLQIADPAVQMIISGQSRGMRERVQATFGTSIGLGAFIAIIMPFVINFCSAKWSGLVRTTAFMTIPLLITISVLTQSRAGLVGLTADVILFAMVQVMLAWRRNPQNLFINAVAYLSPVWGSLALGLTFIVPGLKYRIWGGGAEQMSNDARKVQWHMGTPKIVSHPWGYGVNQSGIVLGYYNRAGVLTIDSYTLKLFLEYGVVGALVFYGMFVSAGAYAARSALEWNDSDDKDASFFVPIAVSLFTYIMITTVYAQEDNNTLAFTLLAALVGLRQAMSQKKAQQPAAVEAPAAPAGKRRGR